MSTVVSTFLATAALMLIAGLQDNVSVLSSYLSFTCALIIWGWLEYAHYSGYLLGPRTTECPAGLRRSQRFLFAFHAMLYHELAMLAVAVTLFLIVLGSANQVAVMTFWVLWLMRVSTELNVFFGVSQLPEHWLPKRLRYLMSYRESRTVSFFFPLSLALGMIASATVIGMAWSAGSSGVFTGYVLVASLLSLAVLEHLLLVIPLPVDRVWSWGLGTDNI